MGGQKIILGGHSPPCAATVANWKEIILYKPSKFQLALHSTLTSLQKNRIFGVISSLYVCMANTILV